MRDIEKYTYDYNKPNFEDYQIVYRRKKVLEILKKYVPQSVLEIGCGMEPLFQYIDYNYEKYAIVEPSKVFYDNAVALANSYDRVLCYNEYFHASEKFGEYEFIICSGLLHELEDPISFLKAIAHVCSENTMVHFNVPNAFSFHRILAKEMKLINNIYEFSDRNKLYQQHSVYGMEELCESVEMSGFEVLEKGSYFLKPFTHAQMHEMMKQRIIDEHVLDGLYEMANVFPDMGSEIFVNCKLSM